MKYDWPDKLDILGCMWAVRERKHLGEWGAVDATTLEISIHKTGTREWDVHTLFEELLHIGENVNGLNFGDGETGHKNLKAVAGWLARVLVENDLVKL